MVCDLPLCSLVRRKVKKRKDLMNKVESCNCWETGEQYHGGRSARAPSAAIQKFHIGAAPRHALYHR